MVSDQLVVLMISVFGLGLGSGWLYRMSRTGVNK